MDYNYIANMLSSSARARDRDVTLFKMWEDKKISTYKCMYEFLKNNKRRQTDYINSKDFESWLNSLGYIREV